MERDGGAGKNPIKGTSKYGSVIVSGYDAGSADGMNEKGLVFNMLCLVESEFGDPIKTGKPAISIGAWGQYFVDNYATVSEAVGSMKDDPITVVAPILPNGRAAAMHRSFSDPTGDSAIFEYLGGRLGIHHGREYRVMTNSPVYGQQLALNASWDQIGGSKLLPGTIDAADRFVRLSDNLKSSPGCKESRLAVADQAAKMYYLQTALMPAGMWVDLNKVEFTKSSWVRKIPMDAKTSLAGEVAPKFERAEPFKWIK